MVEIVLNVQTYLRDGKTLEDLENEFFIRTTYHPTDPLVILNYHQIDSKPKNHPIVKECRGLVLETHNFLLVARAFERFFNFGELGHLEDDFDWTDFNVHAKEDGSICLLYNFMDEWRLNTRGSFGKGLVGESGQSWEELFYTIFSPTKLSSLDKNCTYVFEIVSPHNKVVREYGKNDLYLLSVFNYEWEISSEYVDKHARKIGVQRP